MYSKDQTWIELQNYLPLENQIDDTFFPKEEFVRYDQEINLHLDIYESRDKQNNISVIIFHGVGGNGRLLSFIAVPLQKQGHRVICPDLPGYGYTECPEEVDYKKWCDVGSFLVQGELNEDRKVYVIGLSAGGMLAYNVTCRHPEVSGLIVSNILDNREKEVRKYSAKYKWMGVYGIDMLAKMPDFIRRLKLPVKMITNMNGLVNDGNVLKVLLKDKKGAGNKVSLQFLFSMMQYKPEKEAEEFSDTPVLLVHPEDDRWTPVEISELFFDKIGADKRKVLLEKAGHFPVEASGLKQMNTEIKAFIK